MKITIISSKYPEVFIYLFHKCKEASSSIPLKSKEVKDKQVKVKSLEIYLDIEGSISYFEKSNKQHTVCSIPLLYLI